MLTPYGFGTRVSLPYDQAIERTRALLKEEPSCTGGEQGSPRLGVPVPSRMY